MHELLNLPAEIISTILSHLPGPDLARASCACHLLADHSGNDKLWHSVLEDAAGMQFLTPAPCDNFRELYKRHHPRWFVVRHRLWFSDEEHTGKLLLSRYDPRRGCIEAYSIGSRRIPTPRMVVNLDGTEIDYQPFEPEVRLDLNRPVVNLGLGPQEGTRSSQLSTPVPMKIQTGQGAQLRFGFMLTRRLPVEYLHPSSSVWPPMTLPSPGNQRVRNQSSSKFQASGHCPTSLEELSDANFRIRSAVEFGSFFPPRFFYGHGTRPTELFHTFGSVPKEAYTPTKAKPWQGIWVGDYNAHGCEFLLITQTALDDPLPRKAFKAISIWPESNVKMHFGAFEDNVSASEDEEEEERISLDELQLGSVQPARRSQTTQREFRLDLPPDADDSAPHKGGLRAIKLTGDPNIPRGEYSFIAPDLGSRGFAGVAKDPAFKPPDAPASWQGARMVKAVGHIAHPNYTDDNYGPSHLIMIDENRLAQLWHVFPHISYKHISFYQRLDWGTLWPPEE